MKRFLVVGCNGQFGSIFTKKLLEEGICVDGMDRHPVPQQSTALENYWPGDISAPDEKATSLLGVADCVLLCVPEMTVIDSIPALRDRVKRDGLVVDIASVKTRIADAVHRASPAFGYLSIHPMFAPHENFESRNICVVPLRENENGSHFIRLLYKWKAKLTSLTAAEHDKNTAYIQSLTHAVIVNFVSTLAQAQRPFDTLISLTTPIQHTLLALCARIVTGDSALYWNIQTENPFASEARECFLREWNALSNTIERTDHEAFEKIFRDVAKYLEPNRAGLAKLAARLVQMANGRE
jgi:prephenate dehydrogenase